MICLNICTAINYLPNFVPLMQLLVGSVFVASYMSNGQYSFSNVLNKISDILSSIVGDTNKYKLVNTENTNKVRLNSDYNIVKRSTMLIMAIYGALVLFYCATIQPSASLPSPLGLLLMGIIVSAYLIYSYCILGRTRPKYRDLYIVASLLIIVSLLFIIAMPEYSPFPFSWENKLHIMANIWTLFNMGILWVILLLRKRLLPNTLLRKANKLKFNLNIVSRFRVSDRLYYIAIESVNNQDISHWVLFRAAIKTLCCDHLYFTYSTSGRLTACNPRVTKQLKGIIFLRSNFCKPIKCLLSLLVKNNPRANTTKKAPNSLQRINEERYKILQRGIKRFISLGIVE